MENKFFNNINRKEIFRQLAQEPDKFAELNLSLLKTVADLVTRTGVTRLSSHILKLLLQQNGFVMRGDRGYSGSMAIEEFGNDGSGTLTITAYAAHDTDLDVLFDILDPHLIKIDELDQEDLLITHDWGPRLRSLFPGLDDRRVGPIRRSPLDSFMAWENGSFSVDRPYNRGITALYGTSNETVVKWEVMGDEVSWHLSKFVVDARPEVDGTSEILFAETDRLLNEVGDATSRKYIVIKALKRIGNWYLRYKVPANVVLLAILAGIFSQL